jgi:hypothetical protein
MVTCDPYELIGKIYSSQACGQALVKDFFCQVLWLSTVLLTGESVETLASDTCLVAPLPHGLPGETA